MTQIRERVADGPVHPWVVANRDRVAFALQAVAKDSRAPGKDLVTAGMAADRLGFDAFFLGDHPAWAPEAWMHLGVIAAKTLRVRLGQMVAAVPYRTPLLTARLQSDLDHLSNGRSILGLGIGWNASEYGLGTNEFDRMGIPYPAASVRQEGLEEAVEIIRGVWRGSPFSFQGKHYAATDAAVTSPVEEPPLVIAGGGPKTLGQVARLADCANFGPGPAGQVDTPDEAADKLRLLGEACHAHGRDPHSILPSHFTHWLMVAPTREAVEAKIRHHFPNGLDAFWGAYLVAGTPDEVASHFRGFVAAGIRYFVVQTLDPADEESMALTISDVLPRVAQ